MRTALGLLLTGLFIMVICDVKLTYAVKVTVVDRDVKLTERKTLARINIVAADVNNDDIPDDFDENNIEREEREFKPLPFPVDFRFYDVNNDGEITFHELIEITGRAENVQQAFQASDLNGDERVTADEYSEVPWGYNQNDFVYKS